MAKDFGRLSSISSGFVLEAGFHCVIYLADGRVDHDVADQLPPPLPTKVAINECSMSQLRQAVFSY